MYSCIVLILFAIVFCGYKVSVSAESPLILPIIVILMLSLAFEFIWLKKLKNEPFALTVLFLLVILPCKYVEISVYYLMSGFKSNLIAYLYEFPCTYALLIIPFVDIIVGISYIKKEIISEQTKSYSTQNASSNESHDISSIDKNGDG